MCDVMNQDVLSVIVGVYRTNNSGKGLSIKYEGETFMTNIGDTMGLLQKSERCTTIPGYGFALVEGQCPFKNEVDTFVKTRFF
eukprot:CAMPEP_0171305026 /NCGR_PEP_ID=MMETSP0816-20121228/14793_1 /TAXON_ID=420281 /ORGANISM="Proboscia inermis, Strain CCAP1064/1" /LENGTH=82 /DNA_ID=CAMNT_0011785513 /DNA_START=942 /DNA_END=1187 /DNA_ORIENTATION=-